MEFGLFKKIIDEVCQYVLDINLFLGGESLLHKDISKMITYAKSKELKVFINTNATLLNNDATHKLLDSGLDVLTISFDGYEKKIYEAIRVKASFDKTLNNIIGFLKEKKKRGLKKPYTVFQVIEFNDPNTKSPDDIKRSFHQRFDGLPLDRFTFIPAHNFGGRLSDSEEEKFRVKSRTYHPCMFLWYSMSILWDGQVVPCCIDFRGEYPLGDITKTPLLNIWNGKPMMDLRLKMIERRYKEINLCKGCDVLFKQTVLGIPVRSVKGLWSMFAGNE